ncbi:MAG: hybrid sensor histidine kinase/response regulator [Bacteroidales bacterium]|jgi:signal transduction histidine kinase/FixJ family two-component response regulator|nr:hybrid sensor histidine kinase/response regulator [Bacteroidales bacterium]
MYKTIENKIRVNVFLIYAIVIIICIGLSLYIYDSRIEINVQKENIEKHYDELFRTNELIYTINRVQTEANLFVATRQYSHFEQFGVYLDTLEYLVDTLIARETDTVKIEVLREISYLLREKECIIFELGAQFDSQTPFEDLNERLKSYAPAVIDNFLQITMVEQDTIIDVKAYEKQSFWKRVANVFSPPKRATDSTITIRSVKNDTTRHTHLDSLRFISDVNTIARRISTDYKNHILEIESVVGKLIIADQEISSKISDLLIYLYSHIINSRIEEIQEKEQTIDKSNIYFIIGIIIVLTLIFILTYLIINNVNKAYFARKVLEAANARTKDIMESRHKLLLSVSHDIKTPLNSIMGYLELRYDDTCFSKKDISSMTNSSKHILMLIENLLEFSSLEQGKLKFVQNRFNLYELCVETFDMFEPLATCKKLNFKYDFNFSSRLSICSDQLKIKQIINNILSNSIKYTSSGSVVFEVGHIDKKTHFIVSDTGAGIPEDQIETIFLPFSRIEKNNSIAEGTGIGMYVVKGLIDILNGEIKIKSEIGKGTRIEIIIPVKETETVKNNNFNNILMVDDDVTLLEIMKDMIGKLGSKVTVCNNIDEFDEYLKNIEGYDLLITDMDMGDFSGIEILEKAKNAKCSIPVVVMTGKSDFDIKAAQELGFDDYLKKPVTMKTLSGLLGKSGQNKFNGDTLEEMFRDDTKAITEILEIFINSSVENLTTLKQLLLKNDVPKIKYLCHKMLPMCIQIGADNDLTKLLKKFDTLSEKELLSNFTWKNDVEEIIIELGSLIACIKNKYNLFS